MLTSIRQWAYAMSSRQVWRIMLTMAVTGPLVFVATWWTLSKPPVVVFDSFEEDAVAVSGGQLDLVSTKIDNIPCLTTVARWLWRFDPADPLPDDDIRKRKEWREVSSTPHAPPMVGKVTTYRLVVPLPEHIEPGDWHYQGQAIDTCTGPLGGGPRFSKTIPVRIDPAALQ